MSAFLLDANLSPDTRLFLQETFHFDVVDLNSQNQGTLPDEDVVALAKAQRRVVITLDNDFGEIYYLRERGNFGVIVLQLDNQTVESVNFILGQFFTDPATQDINLDTSLVVIGEHRIRIVRATND